MAFNRFASSLFGVIDTRLDKDYINTFSCRKQSANTQSLLIYGYTNRVQKQYKLSTNVPNEIADIIYLFYSKQNMVNEWIVTDHIKTYTWIVSDHNTKFMKGLHYKTKEEVILKSVPIANHVNVAKLTQELQVIINLKLKTHPNLAHIIHFDSNAHEIDTNCQTNNCILTVFPSYRVLLFDVICYIGGLDEHATRSYFMQFVHVLRYIHDQLGIVQHELQPVHCVLGHSWELKLFIAPDTTAESLKEKNKKKSENIFELGVLLFAMCAGFPPFNNRDPINDWWWNKLSTGLEWMVAAEKPHNAHNRDNIIARATAKIDLFWRAHGRTKHFSDGFKDIVKYMMHPYYSDRYTLDDIIKHEWYKGQTYGSWEMETYIRERIAIARELETFNKKS